MFVRETASRSREAAPAVPARAGVGFKPVHFEDILGSPREIGFFEIHAENYMGAGGPPHARLERLRRDYPLSIYGVGLSLGGREPLDAEHLSRLKRLVRRYQPGLVSEHLAWSGHAGAFLNDLLPFPYTTNSLRTVSARVAEVQDALGAPILIENPATYVVFELSTFSEVDFLRELADNTGCGLLLDVNNVYVCAVNHGFDARDYIDAFPIARAEEIHVAGFAEDVDDDGARLLIDAHCAPVSDPVWRLFERALSRRGPIPTLVEWDNDIPSWPILRAQARRADTMLMDAARHSQPLAEAGT